MTQPDLPDLADLVDGVWTPSDPPLGFDLEDPATGAVRRPAAGTPPHRIEAAVAAASAAHEAGSWAALPAPDRADVLDAVAEAVEGVAAEICALESATTGVPIRQTTPLGVILGGSFRLAAAQLRQGPQSQEFQREDGRIAYAERLPWGPAACAWCRGTRPRRWPRTRSRTRSPRAAPRSSSPASTRRTAANGSPPSSGPRSPRSGVPAGVFQLVHGGAEVGAALVGDPRIRAVSFTGGARRRSGGRGGLRLRHQAGAARARRQQPAGRAARRRRRRRRPRRGRPAHHPQRPVVPGARSADRARRPARRDRRRDRRPARRPGRRRAVGPRDRARSAGALPAPGPGGGRPRRLLAHGGTAVTCTTLPAAGPRPAGTSSPRRWSPASPPRTPATRSSGPWQRCTLRHRRRGGGAGQRHAVRAGGVRARRGRGGRAGRGPPDPGRRGQGQRLLGAQPAPVHARARRSGCPGYGEEGTAETLRFFTNPRVVGVEGGFALHGRS